MLIEDLPEEQQNFISALERDRAWALEYYANRNKEMERMEHWYFKEHYNTEAEISPSSGDVMDVTEDESEHLTILPLPTNILNSVHGILTDEDFYIQCLSSTGRQSERKATDTERFCHGTYWINRQVQGSDPWELAAFDQLLYGWACIYSYWDPDRARAAIAKNSMDFYSYPLVVRRIHPMDIYPLPNGVRERWRGMLHIVKRTVREVEEEWGEIIQPQPARDENGNIIYDGNGDIVYEDLSEDSEVEYIDYWVWRREEGEWMLWHCVMANWQVMKPPTPMPEYEMLPYEVFFCRETPSVASQKMALSFLYPVIEPVQEIEYLVNRMSRLVEMYADPMLEVVDAAAGDDVEIEKGPGTVIRLNPNGRAGYITWSGSPPDISRLLELWRETAQDAFPPVMTGLVGGTSGLDTIALQQGGKLQTNKPRRNLELAIQRVNTKIIRLLQKFSPDEKIQVIGQRNEGDEPVPFVLNIAGRDTRGYENTIVTIRGRFPQEELRNVVTATQAVGAGLMSRREAAGKYLFKQDPERGYREWLIEQVISDPNFRSIFLQKYMQLPAKSEVTQALEQQQQQQQQQAQAQQSQEQPISATDLAGGQLATALATTPAEVQQGVQRTPVVSNIFSQLAGGAPTPGSQGQP